MLLLSPADPELKTDYMSQAGIDSVGLLIP